MATLMLASTAPGEPSGLDAAPASDPAAASLRARALLTRRSRRKVYATAPEPPTSLPTRPAPSAQQVELDYGSEDTPNSATRMSSAVVAPAALPKAPSVSESMDVDECQAREEGEISDTESTPPPKVAPQVSVRPAPSGSPATKSPKDRSPKSPVIPPSSIGPATHTRAEAKVQPLLDATISPTTQLRTTPVDNDSMIVDEEYVRPGLLMNRTEYDTAKDIILDLLGWGVPPEYLVDCGLSREIIYYVFVELNLRLPGNLDLSGLPTSVSSYVTGSPEPLSPPSAVSPRPRSGSTAVRAGSSSRLAPGHPSLPQKPTAPQGSETSPNPPRNLPNSSTSSLSLASVTAVPMSTPASPPSLIDIEQQRRQELLARKAAVLASRKKTTQAVNSSAQVVASSSSSTVVAKSETTDAEMSTYPVPTEAVENFLSSITTVNIAPTPASSDDMDVDIPGLSLNGGSALPSGNPSFQQSTSRVSSVPTPITPHSATLPPESVFSEQSTRLPSADLERSASVENGSDTSGQRGGASASRRPKRPKAADFISAPLENVPPIMAGPPQPRTHTHHHRPPRTRISFAGLRQPRLDSIALSDEEEQGSAAPGPQAQAQLAAAAVLPQVGSPALLQAERELQKAKEQLARLVAKAAKGSTNSNRSSPPIPEMGGTSTTYNSTVKQEEDDTTLTISLQGGSGDLEDQSSSVPMSATSSLAPSTSTSGPATPIDVVSSSSEHPLTGDKALTAEARQEQLPSVVSPAPRSSSPHSMPLDLIAFSSVDVMPSITEASSAQDIPSHASTQSRYTSYRSPLSSYPLLHPHSRFLTSEARPSSLDSVTATADRPAQLGVSGVLSALDLNRLKIAAINQWLSDPSRRLCQYEVPGGGECRDSECEDIHPSQARDVEPTDYDTARFIREALPEIAHLSVEQLQAALEDVRHRKPTASLEARVSEALGSFGYQMAS